MNIPLTKDDFLGHVAALYRLGNMSDCSNADAERLGKPDWVSPTMAHTVCSRLDRMLAKLVDEGVFTAEEHQNFYDHL